VTIPVIFIPGIMGSRLRLPGGLDWNPDSVPNFVKWATRPADDRRRDLGVGFRPRVDVSTQFNSNASSAINGNADLAAIASNVAGAGADPVAFYSDRGWAGVIWRFYGDGLIALETTLNNASPPPNPVYAFGYDWRQPNTITGAALASFIDTVLAKEGANQVALVTHSMGGLVARAASLLPGVPAKVTGVVHSAQPSAGAVVAYRRFKTGCIAPLDGTTLPTNVNLIAFATRLMLRCILGDSPSEYAGMTAGVPSVAELMPNQVFGQLNGGDWLITAPVTDQAAIYDAYRAGGTTIVPPDLTIRFGLLMGPVIEAQLRSSIDRAETFHSTLAGNGYAKTYVLFGDGLETDQTVDLTGANIVVTQPTTGDGTVPQISGSCAGLQAGLVQDSLLLHGVEHSMMFKDAAHNAKLLDFVQQHLI
jgi:pimeloyl-ACP methyl ester carboxylesterase